MTLPVGVARPDRGSALVAGAAVVHAALLAFHPVPGPGPVLHGLEHHLAAWNVVHIAQLGFIGAMGGAVLWLVRRLAGPAAATARGAAVVFVLVYGAYESWTGIGTGALAGTAGDLPAGTEAAGALLVQAHWESVLLGNGSVGAITGSTAWLVATAAAACALRRVGAPRLGILCLVASGLVFAPTHVPPFGPAGMLLFAGAVVLVTAVRPRRSAEALSSPSSRGGRS